MEDINLTQSDLSIDKLGKAKICSPLKLSTEHGDEIVNYMEDDASITLALDKKQILSTIEQNKSLLSFEQAGPRQRIFFDPSKTRAAIVTCGGLCPGINNVIRALVMGLYYSYGVKHIFGIQYGFRGFISKYSLEPIKLLPDVIQHIHELGGSFLGSSRGPQDIGEIVDCLDNMNISILFTIGGDGTLHGAYEIYKQIKKRKLKIAIVGIPKTIDNDISYVEKTFGLETAFSVAAEAIRCAHTEAIGAPNGIGIVKVMGRMSGFIAANAALALNEVNFVLVPEIDFDLDGPKGFFKALENRLKNKDHAVIVLAEGAGQNHLKKGPLKKDSSGNPKLGDIGFFLKSAIIDYFKKNLDKKVNVKYIDPSYMVRAVAANAHDAIYCIQLAQNAVHAAMAGNTGIMVGTCNSQFTHVPIKLAIARKKKIDPEGQLWLSVLEGTGQPIRMINE